MGNTISSLKSRNAPSVTAILFHLLSLASDAESFRFNRGDCVDSISKFPANIVFLHGSNAQNPIIDKATCLARCEDQTGPFSDSVPRLNTWFLPVLVLLFSLYCSSAGGSSQRRKRICPSLFIGAEAAAHALDDPAHYTYCILSRGRAWKGCIQYARIIAHQTENTFESEDFESEVIRIARILSVFEQIHENVEEIADDTSLQKATVGEFRAYAVNYARVNPLGEGTIRNVVGIRSGSIYSALAAIALYAWQVVGAFVPAIGQSPNPSGGRVSYSLLMSWILFVVLCSNTVGDLTCSDGSALHARQFLQRRYPNEKCEVLDRLIRKSFDSSYSYGHAECRRERWFLWFLSELPVLIATVFSVTVTVLPPTYINIHIALPITMGLGYLVVLPGLNLILGKIGIRVKNTVSALANTAILTAASCGLFFNNCEGWRTVWPLNHAGYVINSAGLFDKNDKKLFPLLVSLCIGFQLLYWGLVWWQWSPIISTLTQDASASVPPLDEEESMFSEDTVEELELQPIAHLEGDSEVS
jgi:hypothetical protein